MNNFSENSLEFGLFSPGQTFAPGSTGEIAHIAAGFCTACSASLSAAYYRVDGRATCAICAIQARFRRATAIRRAFFRGLLLCVAAVLLGLAAPFLQLQNPAHSIPAIVLLILGLRLAWHVTAAKQLSLDGPYPAKK
jgi:hypothetical protein